MSDLRADFRRNASETLELAWPIMLSRGISILLGTIDVVMVGQFKTEELAYLSVGRAVVMVVQTVGVGLLAGVLVFGAQLMGSGERDGIGRLWWAGTVYGLSLGIAAGVPLLFLSEELIGRFGLASELVSEGADFVRVSAAGLPAFMVLTASSLYLQSISRPRLTMYVLIGLAPVNAGLNWLFIYGQFGLPQMGATGAALGTTLSLVLGAAVLVGRVLTMPDGPNDAGRVADSTVWRLGRRLIRFGLPTGLASGLETAAFSALTMFSASMGIVAAASYQVFFTVSMVSFVIASGLAAATSVRVGHAVGRGDRHGVKHAGWTGVGTTAVLLLPLVLVCWIFPRGLTILFSDDRIVQAAAAPLIVALGAILIFDAVQFVLMNALRGVGDAWGASAIQIGTFWIVMIPAGWAFGFWLGLGISGLALGMLAGAALGALFFAWRFVHLTAGTSDSAEAPRQASS